jgi:hypothetical protein
MALAVARFEVWMVNDSVVEVHPLPTWAWADRDKPQARATATSV